MSPSGFERTTVTEPDDQVLSELGLRADMLLQSTNWRQVSPGRWALDEDTRDSLRECKESMEERIQEMRRDAERKESLEAFRVT